jgi:hypothetical protein
MSAISNSGMLRDVDIEERAREATFARSLASVPVARTRELVSEALTVEMDSVVLPCSLLWRQVHFRAPTPRTAFAYMTMMEEAIEHGGYPVSEFFSRHRRSSSD